MCLQADMDYTGLRDALQSGDFQLADDLTRAALITLAGPDAEKRNWVYFTEVKFIANTDLQTIDNLWRAASKNRYKYCFDSSISYISAAVFLYTSRPICHVTRFMVLDLHLQAGIQHTEGNVDAEFQAVDKVLQAN